MAFFWNRNKGSKAPADGHSHSHMEGAHGHAHTHHSPAPAQPAPTAPTALGGVKHVIAIASGKGGVGKSTVAANLAVALRYMGSTVGLLDADLYGPSQPGMLGARTAQGKTSESGALVPTEKNGLRFLSMGLYMPGDGPLVWRAPMAMKAIHQFLNNAEWGALDYLLIDLPPGTGDVQLTLAQQARLAGAVIVTTPQEVALGIAKKGLEMFRNLNVPILGIVENMSGFTCKHCGGETAVFKEGGGEKLARSLGVPFLGSLPLDPEIMMSGDEGVPVLDRSTTSHAAQAVLAMANRLDQETRAASQRQAELEPRSFGLFEPAGRPKVLRIEWNDGTSSTIDAFTLRVGCGCASCVDENTGKPLLDPSRVAAGIQLLSVQGVGRYALTASFSDGHSTGIYPFKKLKALGSEPSRAPQATSRPDAAAPAKLSDTAIRQLLDTQINPGVAGHGGHIELVEIQGTRVFLRMSGGCQGCGAAKMTLKDGVERTLKAQLPEISEVIDVTDHSAGSNPYYTH